MKTTTCAALLSLITGIAAHPTLNRLYVRDCKPGSLVCEDNNQFFLCDGYSHPPILMKVAKGTKCVCSGSDCKIVGLEAGDAPEPQPSQSTSAPAPTSQIAAPPASSPSAPEPTQSVPSSTQEPVSQTSDVSVPTLSTPGGIFKENPTSTSTVTRTRTRTSTSTVSPDSTSSAPATSAPSETSAPSAGGVDIGNGKTYIKTFLGNGDASAGWPAQSDWASFDSMWTANLNNVISKSCSSFGQANNSPAESADLKSAILSVAQSSSIDPRFILAIVMQESNGCVRAPTTNYGVTNPGLMQSHDGASSCFNTNPCPQTEIQGMIQDGTNGTPSGDGLKQILAQVGGSGAAQFYKASRVYNSGSIAASGLLQDGIATHCYSSDIANRLLGWSEGPSSCSIS
ncbi:hypothetical protein NQ176_g1050 [Zarea fungicola]|uniref:Uncharacterized protein n=1 Tax=Zarea fungicola TaxID=93591 RepID=A0ACC1NUF9_9HYPO|nr:hypothetical protein NQ176_g1050 [Lecanicillium fungicola]